MLGANSRAALPTQLFFRSIARGRFGLRRQTCFSQRASRISDREDRLFAELNLDRDELALYENIYNDLTIDAPRPDLVVYLQAPVNVLIELDDGHSVRADGS